MINPQPNMGQPKHFIVVDDNRTNNLICEYSIRKLLREAHVNLFTDPEVALDEIKIQYGRSEKETATVLFLDINMPSMTGWDFLEVFRTFDKQIHKQFAIFILTSSVDERDKEKADADPLVAGFFSKPLTINSVEMVMDQLRD